MTSEEKQSIINEILLAIRANSLTIDDLVKLDNMPSDAYIEVSGGRRISCATLKQAVASLFDASIDAERSRAIAAETELIKRIQGTSSDSNSRFDPLKLLGYENYVNKDKGYDSYEAFNSALDSLLYDASVTGYNYGYFRARVLWRDVEIKNILLSSGQQNIIQVISGTLKVSDNTVIADDWNYRILWRQHTNSTGWSTWKVYAGASSGDNGGDVSPELVEQVNENTNNIAQNTSDIEKLMQEIFPVTVSFSITPSDTKEYGTTVNTVKASWSITSKGVSPEVEALKIKSSSNSDGWKTIEDVTTRNYTFEGQNITDKATITLYVKIKNETKARETSRDISFAYRGYIGDVGANFSVGTGTITTLLYPLENPTAQFLSTTKSRTYESSGALSNRRIIYVYPKDKGDITSFIDGNGYDVKSLFTKKTVDVLSLNNETITYNVYISEITTTDAKVTVKFS